jgi:hypothetical protein
MSNRFRPIPQPESVGMSKSFREPFSQQPSCSLQNEAASPAPLCVLCLLCVGGLFSVFGTRALALIVLSGSAAYTSGTGQSKKKMLGLRWDAG